MAGDVRIDSSFLSGPASPWDRTLASVFVEACLYLPFGVLGLRKIRLEALLAHGTDASGRHRVRLADSKYAHETLSQPRSGQGARSKLLQIHYRQVHGHLTDWREAQVLPPSRDFEGVSMLRVARKKRLDGMSSIKIRLPGKCGVREFDLLVAGSARSVPFASTSIRRVLKRVPKITPKNRQKSSN